MAKADSQKSNKKAVGPKPGEFPGKIVDVDVSSEMSDSFLEYAYSVSLPIVTGKQIGRAHV